MDCAAFQASEIDALYDEIDAATSAAMDIHAAGCAACTGRLGRLRAMRRAIAPTLLEELPSGLEDRVVAAAVAALPPIAPPKSPEKGAKIFAFLARPQLAVAAGFVLVLGAAFFYVSRGARLSEPATAARAPASPAEAQDNASPATVSPTATAPGFAAGAPAPMASAVAFADTPPAPAPAGRTVAGKGGDPAFFAAKTLYDDGNCAEALPKLEALAKTNGEADLYAARCVEQTRGCKAAAPRFDVAAKRNAGTPVGSRASLESARCYDSSGQPQTAHARYKSLENDPYVASEAKSALGNTPNATPAPAKPPIDPSRR